MKKLLLFSISTMYICIVFSQANILPSSGRVGIGTIDTSGRLTINGSDINLLRLESETVGGEAMLRFRSKKGNGSLFHADISLFGNNEFLGFKVPSDNTVGSGYKMVLNSSGFLGIGTSSPNTFLEVKGGSSGKQLQLTGTNGGMGIIFVDGSNSGFYNWQVAAQNAIANSFTITPSTALNGTIFSSPVFTMLSSGNLGIGTSSPKSYSNIRYLTLDGVGGSALTFNLNGSESGEIQNSNGGALTYANSTGHYFTGGYVGIGTTLPTEKLTVNGNIKAKKLIVTQTGWSDYVFYKGYKLPSLYSVESFINKFKHLPEIPSAGEVDTSGINVGDMQALLLKKIEELTLYLIRNDKVTNQLRKKVAKQEKEIADLKKRRRK